MISQCIVLTVTISLAAGFVIRGADTRIKRDAPYRGPPAPLNHDGTVAFTHEFQQANDVHNAAYAQEYQRLQAAAALAAAHPDRTSPPSKDYNPQDNGQYNHQDNGQFAPQQEDDGQYRPHLYQNAESNHFSSPSYVSQQSQVPQQYNPTAYNAAPYQATTHQQYSPTPQNQHHVPAPLNPDGTVAHTPEYLALAASLHNSQHALTRHRRSLSLYHGPPAPLNHDGTVANTPEVEHAIAVHKAAYDQEYLKLQAVGYGHQSYESQQEDDGQYKPHLYDNGDHSSQQGEDLHYNNNQYGTNHYSQEPSYSYNPEAHIPAPLNHDGTVAHTAEYKAIAAAHQAEFENALHSVKHQSILPYNSFSQSSW